MILPSIKLNYPDEYIIYTERLVLKPPSYDILNDLYFQTSDSRITDFLSWEAHSSIEITKEWINSMQEAQRNDKGYHWIIFSEGKVAGLISLIDVKRQHRSWIVNRAELSYWLGVDFQNKGFATEAGKAVLEFAYKKLCFYKVVLGHVVENISSEKVAKRLGFERYGFEQDAFYKVDRWYGMIWYHKIFNKG